MNQNRQSSKRPREEDAVAATPPLDFEPEKRETIKIDPFSPRRRVVEDFNCMDQWLMRHMRAGDIVDDPFIIKILEQRGCKLEAV